MLLQWRSQPLSDARANIFSTQLVIHAIATSYIAYQLIHLFISFIRAFITFVLGKVHSTTKLV